MTADRRRTRILLVGGLGHSLINFRGPLLAAFKKIGCDVHAAAPEIEEDEHVSDALREMGATAHSVPIARTGLNPIADLYALVALTRLMRRIRPDLFIGYTIKPVVWGTLAAWIARVPRRYAMITGLGYAFTGPATRKRAIVRGLARFLYRVALSRCHGVFFQNPDDLNLFRDLGLIPKHLQVTVVNGSGVDLLQYPARPLPVGNPRFLMIARLLADKGIREYAAAAAMVRRTHPTASFHLVGGLDPNPDGVSQAEVDSWVKSGDVIWHGVQSDVRPFLADAHVFVLPSYREGTPRTVLEAMATGRPIITTDAPGCRETVVDGVNGFLVPPRSIEALARAMARLIEEPGMIPDLAAQSLEMVRERYCAEKVTVSMLEAMNITNGNAT